MKLTLGSRTSALAMWQSRHVMDTLQTVWPGLECTIEPFVTQGDKTLDRPLPEIGGKGLFTLELENGLREGRIDLAVHSLKDLPVDDAPGLTLGAILGRADVRDVLVAKNGQTLDTLPPGAVVGTSSLRRQAQLLARRPELTVRSIRGNVETRIHKALHGDYDATLLAGAGVTRLGLDAHISQWLALDVMLPAPGQGALAVQCRATGAAGRYPQRRSGPVCLGRAGLSLWPGRGLLDSCGSLCDSAPRDDSPDRTRRRHRWQPHHPGGRQRAIGAGVGRIPGRRSQIPGRAGTDSPVGVDLRVHPQRAVIETSVSTRNVRS
jgi:hydroxymethylbilane synthase